MASPAGRVFRAVVGVMIVLVGLLVGSATGAIIAIIGLVPLSAGVFDFCLFAPFFKLPISGKEIRTRVPKQ